jgi:hypothetical protein
MIACQHCFSKAPLMSFALCAMDHSPRSAPIFVAVMSSPRPAIRHNWKCRPCRLPGYTVFFAGSILCPFRLKLLARLRLFGHAPIQVLLRASFELALPRDFEFRHASAVGVGCREVRIMIGRWISIFIL